MSTQTHTYETQHEDYIKEYYGVILKRLKDIGVDLDIEEKKKFPI